MTKRELSKLIYLSGHGGDYKVHHHMPGEAIVCHVPTVKIGNAIVRALRELAEQPNKHHRNLPDLRGAE